MLLWVRRHPNPDREFCFEAPAANKTHWCKLGGEKNEEKKHKSPPIADGEWVFFPKRNFFPLL